MMAPRLPRDKQHINDLYEQIQFAMNEREEMRENYLALEAKSVALTADRDRYKAALEKAVRELENLFAMIEGEVPSLLEDHHSYPGIVAAIKDGNEALSPATPSEKEG